ncbi:hypothetical protein Ocin01_01253 [Orchesella cincta]|uniref:Uncharacterized protein n=1 Tax=Orchesella cincta TaxID=48709 RepID=A0A1D2NJH5_ORCCI|nr:hypothetical protein Ocin01_01253 [Orchesella cincta]
MQAVKVVLALAFVCAANAAPQIYTSDIFHIPDVEAEVDVQVPTEHAIILPPYFQNLLNMPQFSLPPPPPVQFYRPTPQFQLQLGQHRFFFNWFDKLMGLLNPTTTTTAAPTTAATTAANP